MTTYKNLEAWKLAMKIVKEIYVLTKMFPKDELFALTSQIKRAVISIPSNIAEGIGRNHKKDTIQFLHISRGSLYELETQLCIALMLEFLNEETYRNLELMMDEEVRIINGLIRSYENRTDLK